MVRSDLWRRWLYALTASCALMVSKFGLAQANGPAIPFREEGVGLGQQAMTTGGIALLLLAVAVAALLALRRKLGMQLADPNFGGLRCAASTRLSAQTRVHVLVYRGREYLLAQSGDSLLHLAEYEAGSQTMEKNS